MTVFFTSTVTVLVCLPAVILLEERQIEVPVQKMGGTKAGDTGADDGK